MKSRGNYACVHGYRARACKSMVRDADDHLHLLHVHAVPAQLVRDPGHSGAPGADGNVGWKPAHGGIPTGPRA